MPLFSIWPGTPNSHRMPLPLLPIMSTAPLTPPTPTNPDSGDHRCRCHSQRCCPPPPHATPVLLFLVSPTLPPPPFPHATLPQATWNLCPVKISYNSDCYFSDDQAFSDLSGEVHLSISDAPDGEVRGGVSC